MTYAYDSFGRRTSATSASLSRTIAYQYDLRGLRTRLEVGGVVTIAYALDGAGRLTSVQKGTDTAAQYVYDTGGRRGTLILPNGVTTVYDYDTNDRVTDIVTSKSGPGTLASFTYTLDDTGIPTDVDQSLMAWDSGQSQWVLQSQAIAYTLDGNGRLTAETRTVGENPPTATYSESFVYDPVGNRLTRVKNDGTSVTTANTPNERNQIVTSLTGGVTTTFSYDQNGNTTRIANTSVTKDMAYDKFNRQTSWTDSTNSEATTFAGAKWHRTSYTANGGGDTRFLYDGDNVLADFVEDTQNQGSYIASRVYVTPFLDDNLSMTDLTGEQPATYYYSQDRRHSVVTLTDSNGAMVNAYDLTAMGERLPGTHVSVVQRYEYTGRELASESHEYYFRYRAYGPDLGQFVTRDPLGYVDGMGLYGGRFAGRLGRDPHGLVSGKYTELDPVDDATVAFLAITELRFNLSHSCHARWYQGYYGKTYCISFDFRAQSEIHLEPKPNSNWYYEWVFGDKDVERVFDESADDSKADKYKVRKDALVKHEGLHIKDDRAWYKTRKQMLARAEKTMKFSDLSSCNDFGKRTLAAFIADHKVSVDESQEEWQ